MNWAIFAQLLGMGGGSGAVAAIGTEIDYTALAVAGFDFRAAGANVDFTAAVPADMDFTPAGRALDFRARGVAFDYTPRE